MIDASRRNGQLCSALVPRDADVCILLDSRFGQKEARGALLHHFGD